MADVILNSGRDDWIYLAVGGQTTLRDFLVAQPAAAANIQSLIIMGGNWCAGGNQVFPGIFAPVGELNIACDPHAANQVLENNTNPMAPNIYYVPLEVGANDQLQGQDYARIQIAAAHNPGAAAILQMYHHWSAGARADKASLVHSTAMAMDPENGVPPMFDVFAVMLALDLFQPNDCIDEGDDMDRFAVYDFEAVRFVQVGEVDENVPGSPRAAFSLHTGESFAALPKQCPALTNYTFAKHTTIMVRQYDR